MGAYLSEPMTQKETEEGEGNKLKFGACSMQGWRVSQEDAHNCIAKFDEDSSLFAVYDGHGGAEVAIYLSRHLPEFLKACTAYKNGEFVKGLEECFLKFDESIKTPEVLKEIQQIAKSQNAEDEAAVDYEEENVGALYEEATMPLDKLVAKYQTDANLSTGEIEDDCKPGSSKEAVAAGSSKSGGSSSAGGSSRSSRGSTSTSSSKEVNGADSSMSIDSDSDDKAVSSSSSSSPGEQAKTEKQETCDSSTSVGDLIVEGKSITIEPAPKKSAKEPAKESSSKTTSSEPSQSTASVNGNGSTTSADDDAKVGKAEEKSSDSEATSKDAVNGDSSTSEADAGTEVSSANGKLEKAEVVSDSGNSDKKAVNGGSSSTSDSAPADSSTTKEAEKTLATPSETPRRKKSQPPVLVKMEDSKPARRSPRKSQQKSFDCSDSDESDDDDAGYNMGDSDSEDVDDEEEDLEEDSSNEDEEDDDEDDYEDEETEEDERFLSDIQEPGYDSGSTAVVCLMKWEADGLSLWVANAGDSRCVVCREGKAVDMSYDHKPELDEEAQRIVKAGGKVTQEGRVNGGLNLSRAIGDHSYKQNATLPLEEQMISPLPSIEHIVLNPTKDKFVVLACDGVWNSMTSQEVIDFVGQRLEEKKPLPKICEELFDACLSPDTCGDGTGCDNMTAIIVQLSDAPQAFSGSKRRCSEEPTQDPESTKKSRVD